MSRNITLGIIYGYKSILQIVALVFSFSIGRVRLKGLNDAKYIAAAVYVTSIVTAVIIVSLYSLKTFLNLYAALFSFGFLSGTTVILALVFIPKVHSIIEFMSFIWPEMRNESISVFLSRILSKPS